MNPSRAKVETEGVCRVCGTGPAAKLDAAHLWPRSQGAKGFDNPDLIVPLCSAFKGGNGCHDKYDHHQLDLLSSLTLVEELAVVSQARLTNPRGSGIAGAYRRLSGPC